MTTRGGFGLIMRLALRELRAGPRGFNVFLACLALGVMAIAGVGSVARSLDDGLAGEGRTILGGDMAFSLVQREASATERAFLDRQGRVSAAATMRAMARSGDGRATLVEVKAVDGAYPLYGTVATDPASSLPGLLAAREGVYGAVAGPDLLARLEVAPGARLRVGDANIELRAVLKTEPDQLAGGIPFGPRLIIAADALRATGLLQPGSVARWHYRVRLAGDASDGAIKAVTAAARAQLPDAGWEIRTRANASPELGRNIERFTQYLTLVGLTSLLIGGVGVANAVKHYLDRKRDVIATLKSIGATGSQIFAVYLIQVLTLALAGTAFGLAAGAAIPFAVAAAFAAVLPIPLAPAIHAGALALAALSGVMTAVVFALWPLGRAHDVPVAALFRDEVAPAPRWPRRRYIAAVVVAGATLAAIHAGTLALAALYGVMTAVVFALWPLGRAHDVPVAALFRDEVAPAPRWPRRRYIAAVVVAGATLAALAVTLSYDRRIAVMFVVAAAAVFVTLRLVPALGVALARRAPRPRSTLLRLVLANVHRPGALTPTVVLSLGLGLALLVTLSLIDANLRRQFSQALPDRAPSFYFVDIQGAEAARFEAFVRARAPDAKLEQVPMLRGRIVAARGVTAEDLRLPDTARQRRLGPAQRPGHPLRERDSSGLARRRGRMVAGRLSRPAAGFVRGQDRRCARAENRRPRRHQRARPQHHRDHRQPALGRLADAGHQFRHGAHAQRAARCAPCRHCHVDLSGRRRARGRTGFAQGGGRCLSGRDHRACERGARRGEQDRTRPDLGDTRRERRRAPRRRAGARRRPRDRAPPPGLRRRGAENPGRHPAAAHRLLCARISSAGRRDRSVRRSGRFACRRLRGRRRDEPQFRLAAGAGGRFGPRRPGPHRCLDRKSVV